MPPEPIKIVNKISLVIDKSFTDTYENPKAVYNVNPIKASNHKGMPNKCEYSLCNTDAHAEPMIQ